MDEKGTAYYGEPVKANTTQEKKKKKSTDDEYGSLRSFCNGPQ